MSNVIEPTESNQGQQVGGTSGPVAATNPISNGKLGATSTIVTIVSGICICVLFISDAIVQASTGHDSPLLTSVARVAAGLFGGSTATTFISSFVKGRKPNA